VILSDSGDETHRRSRKRGRRRILQRCWERTSRVRDNTPCPGCCYKLTIHFQPAPSRSPLSAFLILHQTSAKVCSHRMCHYHTSQPTIGIRNTTTVFDEPARERVRLASGCSPSNYGESHTPLASPYSSRWGANPLRWEGRKRAVFHEGT